MKPVLDNAKKVWSVKGVLTVYRPSYDPDVFISVDNLYHPHISTVIPQVNDEVKHLDYPNLYSSKTIELLLDWQTTGSSAKSNGEINCLVHGVLHHPEFELDTLQSFHATCENWKADAAEVLRMDFA